MLSGRLNTGHQTPHCATELLGASTIVIIGTHVVNGLARAELFGRLAARTKTPNYIETALLGPQRDGHAFRLRSDRMTSQQVKG
jgi:hypothetical protein